MINASRLKRATVVVVTIYICFTCYTGYILLSKHGPSSKKTSRVKPIYIENGTSSNAGGNDGLEWNPWGEDLEQRVDEKKADLAAYTPPIHTVEIWAKAAIGIYLWEHIFDAPIEKHRGGYVTGTKRVGDIRFKYRYGPQLAPTTAPQDVEYLILVLNGRSKDKIDFARTWLDFLPNFRRLRRTIVVLLGDEQCKNDWLLGYIRSRGGIIDAVFVVYDSPLVDNDEFFQWPLGVATYRGFGRIDRKKLDLESPREFTCNFVGTEYAHSSRQVLAEMLAQNAEHTKCFVKTRHEWQPNETPDSLQTYEYALRLSDLTLNPVGFNVECYRIYEALALGSIPVVEDRLTPGQCALPALKLLKEHNAPLVFVRTWHELPALLEREKNITLREKIVRRQEAVRWYDGFKKKMRVKLVEVLRRKFFTVNNDDKDEY